MSGPLTIPFEVIKSTQNKLVPELTDFNLTFKVCSEQANGKIPPFNSKRNSTITGEINLQAKKLTLNPE